MTGTFLKLSQLLTGFDKLNAKLGEIYFTQLRLVFGKPFDEVISAFKKIENSENISEQFKKDLWSDGVSKNICQSIIECWYNAALGQPAWVAPPEAYFEALLWKAVDAHPPALSGGYLGYWRYAPEN